MNPIILYDNRFLDGALTATDTADGFHVDNIKDRNADTFWKAASYGTKYITRAPLATDDVDLADLCLSLVDGYASVDFSAADVLTDYIVQQNPHKSYRLVVLDSAGKKIIGYIKAVSPTIVASTASTASTVYAAWAGKGIWEYTTGGWQLVHGTTPVAMCASASLLFATFAGDGLYKYDGATWTKLNTDTPTVMAAYGTMLYYEYGGKTYKYNTATDTRTQINGVPATLISLGADDLVYMNFPGAGVYTYVPSTGTYTKINTTEADKLWAVGTNCYATYPGYAKVYIWNVAWEVVHNSVKTSAVGIVNNSDFYAEFGDGTYKHVSGTTWTKVSDDVPDMLTGTATKLYAHFAPTKLMKSWDGADWETVLSASTSGVTITSTPDGATYNWESIESGFDDKDSSGYAYKISEADACDGLFLFGHNLGTAEASVSVESTDDETNWTERLAAFTPSDDRAIMKLLTSFRAASKRLKIVSPSVAPYIAEAILGNRLEMPYPPDASMIPYEEGIESEMTLSRGGRPLGVVTSYFPIDIQHRFSNLLRTWATDNFVPFWEYAKYFNAFAYAPDLDTWPDDVFFCTVSPDMKFRLPVSVLLYVDYIDLIMRGYRS